MHGPLAFGKFYCTQYQSIAYTPQWDAGKSHLSVSSGDQSTQYRIMIQAISALVAVFIGRKVPSPNP